MCSLLESVALIEEGLDPIDVMGAIEVLEEVLGFKSADS
jgi:hypothetical protein